MEGNHAHSKNKGLSKENSKQINKRHRMSVFYAFSLFVTLKAYAFDLKCPTNGHRLQRVKYVCNNSPASYYSCLFDQRQNIYKESCKIPSAFVRPGQKYVISVLRRNTNCSTKRFQPFKFWSHELSFCVFKKSQCRGIGQIMYSNDSLLEDNKCRCDHEKGYSFLQEPKHLCYCVPSVEDCTCYQKRCPINYKLSSDFKCRSIFSLPTSSVCKETKTTSALTSLHEPLHSVQDIFFSKTKADKEFAQTSKLGPIVSTLLFTATILALGIIVLLYDRICNRLHRDHWFSKNKKQTSGDTDKHQMSSIENGYKKRHEVGNDIEKLEERKTNENVDDSAKKTKTTILKQTKTDVCLQVVNSAITYEEQRPNFKKTYVNGVLIQPQQDKG